MTVLVAVAAMRKKINASGRFGALRIVRAVLFATDWLGFLCRCSAHLRWVFSGRRRGVIKISATLLALEFDGCGYSCIQILRESAANLVIERGFQAEQKLV